MPQMMSLKEPSGRVVRPGNMMQSAVTASSSQPLSFDANESVTFGDDGVEATVQPESTAAPVKEVTPEVRPTDTTPTTTTEVAAPESAVFDLPKDEPEASVPVKPTTQIPSGPRNYDEFPEEIRGVLRALNNKQFAEFAPKLRDLHKASVEAAELRSRVNAVPQYFYEHPEAYRLDPEFQRLNQDVQYINFESNHYASQLARIKRGEAWQQIEGYNPQTGEPVFKTVEPKTDGTVDYNSEIAVSQMLTKLNTIGTQRAQQIGSYQATHSANAQRAQQEIAEIDTRLFPNIKDVASLSKEDKSKYDLAVSISPPYFRNHPLTPILGKSFVMYWRLLNMYQKSLSENKKLRDQIEDRTEVDPVPIPGGGAPKKPVKPGEFDPDEVVNLKEDFE